MQKRLEQVLPSECLPSYTCGAALSMTGQRHTCQGKTPAAVQTSLLVTAAAAAAAAALGCTAAADAALGRTAPWGSLAILGHQARAAWPQCAGAEAVGRLLCPSLDAGEAKRQLRIRDKVCLQQSGAPLRSCTMTAILAVVKRSSRTLQLQPAIVVGCFQCCA